ncbi:MAG: TAXI family TRAP transporter solute-binding subunit [Polyangia bacterium]
MRTSKAGRTDQTGTSWKPFLLSWRGALYLGLPLAALLASGILAAQKLVQPPPSTIRILSGPDGSSYRLNAEKYKKIIEHYGVKVVILPSHGSLDNLHQLANAKTKADVGFVQGGLTDGVDITHLVSLGSVFAQPLMVYYRHAEPVERLSQLKGKRLAIGPEGSGARALALKLLQANEMDAAPTVLLELAGEEAADELIAGKIDAAFLMGDSATPAIMRKLRDNPDIEIANFRQADGYLRKFRFLSKLTLPEGAYDLGKNEPPRTLTLVGPTVELVARHDLHPALSDLLISAAREVHSGPGLFRNAGEYPAPLARDFPISADAERYYKSGGQFLYKRLPFWLANLIDRLLVVVVPLLVILVPATKIIPNLYRWRMRARIYRWYGALMAIEREMLAQPAPEAQGALFKRIDAIEHSVNELKTPLSFADQLYVLRDHVGMVRQHLLAATNQAKETSGLQ